MSCYWVTASQRWVTPQIDSQYNVWSWILAMTLTQQLYKSIEYNDQYLSNSLAKLNISYHFEQTGISDKIDEEIVTDPTMSSPYNSVFNRTRPSSISEEDW